MGALSGTVAGSCDHYCAMRSTMHTDHARRRPCRPEPAPQGRARPGGPGGPGRARQLRVRRGAAPARERVERARRRLGLRHPPPAPPGRRAGLLPGPVRRGAAPEVLLPHRRGPRADGAVRQRVVRRDAGPVRPARWEEGHPRMTTHNGDDDVVRYADAVRAAVAGLEPGERAQLVGDLEAHLREVAAESDAPLVERLGPPEVYAAELRTAYGAPPQGGRRR